MTWFSLYTLLSQIHPVYPLYFFYGAAFIFLGISISVRDLKASDLKLASYLWMLGMFGLIHGLYEWFQLYPLIQGESLSKQEIFLIKLILLHIFILSFFFLLQFGVLLIHAPRDHRTSWVKWIPALVALIWIAVLWRQAERLDLLFLWQAEIGIRYTLGLGGGLVAGYSLIVYSGQIKTISRHMARNFLYSGMAIAIYGLLAGIPHLRSVLSAMDVPVELLRGVAALFLSYFISKALNIFNIETRQKTERQTRLLLQTEKLASLGQLAAGIAHEINNPLTNASLISQSLIAKLNKDGAADPMMEKLAAVEKNIDRASTIAQELLLFSRQKETRMAPQNVNDIIEGSLTLLRYRLKNIDLQQELAPVSDIMGDRGKLEQVFINMISNALEAMPEGGRLTIASSEKNGLIEVRLRDTGIGISKENLTRIFDPFFTTKEIGEGTGLGLSICYGIMKQHGGDIEVSSVEKQGTTVTVTIPVRKSDEKDSDCR